MRHLATVLWAGFHRFSYYLIPGRCILCRSPTCRQLDICAACAADLPWLRFCCPYCAEPGTDNLPCANCLRDYPPYSSALCGFEYRFPVDSLIHRFKDTRHLASGHVLTQLCYQYHHKALLEMRSDDLLIVPVPISPAKIRKRGFNQSELVARQLGAGLGITPELKLLRKLSDHADQKSLSLAKRKTNLANTIAVNRKLHGNRVLLIDDVITTGATITEVTHQLLQAGASDVVVFAIARTPRHKPWTSRLQ